MRNSKKNEKRLKKNKKEKGKQRNKKGEYKRKQQTKNRKVEKYQRNLRCQTPDARRQMGVGCLHRPPPAAPPPSTNPSNFRRQTPDAGCKARYLRRKILKFSLRFARSKISNFPRASRKVNY